MLNSRSVQASQMARAAGGKASIAAIESDLKVLQARMRLDERRNEQSVQQVRLDLMTDKMMREMAVSMSNLASNKLKRAVKLVHDGTIGKVKEVHSW